MSYLFRRFILHLIKYPIVAKFLPDRARAHAADLERRWNPHRDAGIYVCVCVGPLVQEVLPIERVALRGAEAGVADDAAQLFFRRAVGYACGAHYIFF
jgi:hypothetical protein